MMIPEHRFSNHLLLIQCRSFLPKMPLHFSVTDPEMAATWQYRKIFGFETKKTIHCHLQKCSYLKSAFSKFKKTIKSYVKIFEWVPSFSLKARCHGCNRLLLFSIWWFFLTLIALYAYNSCYIHIKALRWIY